MFKNMPQKKRTAFIQGFLEFIKLQIAGNVPVWGTLGLFALLDQVFYANNYWALLVSTVAAYTLFYFITDLWVFSRTRKSRNKTTEVWRFIVFTSFSALLIFNINWFLNQYFGISLYIAQFISAGLSIFWTFPGYKFWVFSSVKNHRKPKTKKFNR